MLYCIIYDVSTKLDPELNISDVGNVLNQLKVGANGGFSLKKWRALGRALKVPENKLEEFEEDHRKAERRLVEAIKHWIRNGEVTWKELWEALCHSTVSHENLGREIRDWYRLKTWRDPRQVNCDNRLQVDLCGSYYTLSTGLFNHMKG